jgi:hypothetical protein
MNESPESQEPIRLEVVYDEAPRHVLHINFAKFSHVGGDVFLDVGVVDDQALLQLRDALRAGRSDITRAIPAYVTHRFGMTIDGLELLKRNTDDIWQKLKNAGLVRDLQPQPTGPPPAPAPEQRE